MRVTKSPRKVLFSWSTGKDLTWGLQVLRQQPEIEIIGLLITFNEAFNRGTGFEPLFWIWTTEQDTPALARRMLAVGLADLR